jgi:hypothetical protein
LLHFINGTDTQKGETIEEKPLSAKAAKRARQKQRKVCNVKKFLFKMYGGFACTNF